MKLIISCLVFCAFVYIGASEPVPENNDDGSHVADGTMGSRVELLLSKLDAIASELQKVNDKFSALEHQIENKILKLDRGVGRVLQNQYIQPTAISCKDVPTNLSGTYLIRLSNELSSVPFRVYCEQQTFGGGWIVVQYRYDGALDFYRGWSEFRDGFGDLEKEFWLGLEKVHRITKGRRHELVVELKDFNGTYKYAHYDAFEVGSESEEYVLKELGEYNGTAGNEMRMNNGMKFTTKDRDNDENGENCAQIYQGAWWHQRCTAANLNGQRIDTIGTTSMHWHDFNRDRRGLSYSRMMIRELD